MGGDAEHGGEERMCQELGNVARFLTYSGICKKSPAGGLSGGGRLGAWEYSTPAVLLLNPPFLNLGSAYVH